jgi:hypothetical protein
MRMDRNSAALTSPASILQTRLDREMAKATKKSKQPKEIKLDFDESRQSSKRIWKLRI